MKTNLSSYVRAALSVPIADASDPGVSAKTHERTSAYWRRYVLSWIGRRFTGRSSDDTRAPKIATLQPAYVASARVIPVTPAIPPAR